MQLLAHGGDPWAALEPARSGVLAALGEGCPGTAVDRGGGGAARDGQDSSEEDVEYEEWEGARKLPAWRGGAGVRG